MLHEKPHTVVSPKIEAQQGMSLSHPHPKERDGDDRDRGAGADHSTVSGPAKDCPGGGAAEGSLESPRPELCGTGGSWPVRAVCQVGPHVSLEKTVTLSNSELPR